MSMMPILGALFVGFLSIFWLTPLGVPALKLHTGGLTPLELRYRYSPEEAYALLDVYGMAGIAHWRRMLFLDMVFPAVYAALFATLAILWADWADISEPWRLLIIVCPVAAALSDYLENFCLLYILNVLPRRDDAWVRRASLFTSAKFAFSGATFGIPLVHSLATILF